MRRTALGSRLLALGLATSLFGSSLGAQQTGPPVFRSDVDLVVVDVVVRDRSGAIVRGLTAADFEVREDDRPQQVTSFDLEEVTPAPPRDVPVPGGPDAGHADPVCRGIVNANRARRPGRAAFDCLAVRSQLHAARGA